MFFVLQYLQLKNVPGDRPRAPQGDGRRPVQEEKNRKTDIFFPKFGF